MVRHAVGAAPGADQAEHWYGRDAAVDRYLHAARRWLDAVPERMPLLDVDAAQRPFPFPEDL
jgi:hypothetical protein